MPRTKEAAQAWRDTNRELVRARNRAYRKKRMKDPAKRAKVNKANLKYRQRPENRNMILSSRLKHDYGISLEQYDKMLAEQNGVCFICHRAESKILNSKLIRLAVDHDHVTGQIRRLLCSACNVALGLLDESSDRARTLAMYIESFKGEV